ncbi:MAG: hypothetical protein EOP82_29435 [Variovorax sp.]|nr:MAG: hypothetical protein EOP82_29435 [Variovorax sp.]
MSTDTLSQAESRYASRKWILAAVVVVAAIALRISDLLSEALSIDLLKWTLGLYFTANVAQRVGAYAADAHTIAADSTADAAVKVAKLTSGGI